MILLCFKKYRYLTSSFERPAFQNLFRELEQGAINCILVKDLSRFGRNYIEVGRYLERIFPVMRVRLIAVTDNYDSQSAWKTSDSIMVPMRNLLNDAYCRDISVKIKSQLAVKRKRGDFVGSIATYGYQKDPSNHTKLIVDELAAETVQDIFLWKISGMNNQRIADRLNAKKVPSPAARKLQSGTKLSLHFRKSDEPPWSAKAVDRILHNEVYIGKLVQGKTRRLDYRSKKKIKNHKDAILALKKVHDAGYIKVQNDNCNTPYIPSSSTIDSKQACQLVKIGPVIYTRNCTSIHKKIWNKILYYN